MNIDLKNLKNIDFKSIDYKNLHKKLNRNQKIGAALALAAVVALFMYMSHSGQLAKDEQILTAAATAIEGTGFKVLEKQFYDSMAECETRQATETETFKTQGYQPSDISAQMMTEGAKAFGLVKTEDDFYAVYCLPSNGRAAYFKVQKS